jgi:hypothetical protein
VAEDEVIDPADEFADALGRTAADRLVGDQREEALDLIELGTVGRDEMQVPARSGRQPALTLACMCVL